MLGSGSMSTLKQSLPNQVMVYTLRIINEGRQNIFRYLFCAIRKKYVLKGILKRGGCA